jgi:uncharacterized protein involved in exopolysaccharide biosynthesis
MEDEISILDYLIVILKRKKIVIGIPLFAGVVAMLISFLMPPVYRAETRILTPHERRPDVAIHLLGNLDIPYMVGDISRMRATSGLYIAILRSRTVLDHIIDKFNLMEVYDTESREATRLKLLDSLSARSDKNYNDIVIISVEDTDPKRAAGMANAFVEELKTLAKGLAVTEAAQRRLFFEEQLKETKLALTKAEKAMKEFQEKAGALQIESQTKAVIDSIAKLRAQIAAKEVNIKALKTYTTPNSPDLQKTLETLRTLKTELKKLEAKTGKNPDPLMLTERMPEVETEYIRRLRDLKFNETLYELLAKQYKVAKLDEAKDAAVIQVIDEAVPSEKKIRPNRVRMVLFSTVATFFFSVVMAFFIEYVENASKSVHASKLELLKRYLSFRRK